MSDYDARQPLLSNNVDKKRPSAPPSAYPPQQLPSPAHSTVITIEPSRPIVNPTIIPQGSVVYNAIYTGIPLNDAAPSTAHSIGERDGAVVTSDQIIQHSADELWRYIRTQANHGGMRANLNISGFHMETRIVVNNNTHVHNDSNHNSHRGHGHHHDSNHGHGHNGGHVHNSPTVSTKQVHIVDFSLCFDMSQLVNPQWHRIVTTPHPDTHASRTIRECLEEFTEHTGSLKEFRVLKAQVGWDIIRLNAAITQLIRGTGYTGEISVRWETMNDKVVARSNSIAMDIASSVVMQVLCFLTCLWIFFMPAYFCGTKRILDCMIIEYPMLTAEDMFFHRNSNVIATLAIDRRKEVNILATI